jgi:hypothetical protein
MVKDIYTVAPEMPKGYYPEYGIWEQEFERFEINPETILVGHSCGGGFLIRWLSENPERKAGKVILVAPWLGLRFNDEPFDETFFAFEPRREIAQQTKGLYIFCSTDDFSVVLESVKIIREKVDSIQYQEFSGKGHFTKSSLGTEEFPELLEELLAPGSDANR